MWLLCLGGYLLCRGGWGSNPRRFWDGGGRSNGSPLLHYTHYPFPKVGKRLVLLHPHLGLHFLIKFCCHLCKRKTLKKKKRENEENSRQQRTKKSTYSSLQSLWHEECMRKAMDPSSDEPKFLGRQNHQSRQSSLRTL